MADVKFMDLSENDNPATTDSVLIGNSTDGLKRTSVGAIVNLFSFKGLFHFETVTAQNNPTSTTPNAVAITAPDVPGYTFAFWLAPSPVSHAYYSHVDPSNSQQADLWINIQDGDTTPRVCNIIAVYVNSKLA